MYPPSLRTVPWAVCLEINGNHKSVTDRQPDRRMDGQTGGQAYSYLTWVILIKCYWLKKVQLKGCEWCVLCCWNQLFQISLYIYLSFFFPFLAIYHNSRNPGLFYTTVIGRKTQRLKSIELHYNVCYFCFSLFIIPKVSIILYVYIQFCHYGGLLNSLRPSDTYTHQ